MGPPRSTNAFAHLGHLVDAVPETRHLVHSDVLNHNILVAGHRVTAMLDWGNAMAGDFLYDIALFCFWAPWYPAWDGIDFREEAARHYGSLGLDLPCYEDRLRCYEVHIGLDHLVYNAYMGRWDELARVAEHTLAITRG